MKFTTLAAFVATAAGLIGGAAAAGGFVFSCSSWRIENNNFLRASCTNLAGGTTTSVIDLNACIGIDPNQLVCRPNGNYAAQGCANCDIRMAGFMLCGCPGGSKMADLNQCIGNNNGLLVC
ncbi:Cyanovirin-N [Coprinopsis sp. MPI-PUGE-AT-0042]|nr:Cyanovirin-N [Coprinopsis sp. MPI-PUGE-AT-0042]